MPNVFDVEAATKCVADVAKLANELATVDERRKALKAQLKAKQKELSGLMRPKKARKRDAAA
jgi:hypothetical protein